ncbi:hypothetical protein EDB89DRAFT_1889842 [Lactarius sanguifluus]|nr:hypothetical protein EDB89DRAFT_1889842 [Lactarius sanguifluus]
MVTPCTTVSTLNHEVLLIIFDWYRLYNTADEDQTWNGRWWYKPIHVCRKWRYLILSSPTRLDLHLVCTHGIPVGVMLSHSPPLPLIIYYPGITGETSVADGESALFALQQLERVRHIHVVAWTVILHSIFKAIDNELPILETLSLHSSTKSRIGLVLPEKLRAPLLRDLALSNIAIPIQSPLLRHAEDLVTLRLWNVPASPEFHPAHLVAQLSGMSRLEILKIHFYAAISNREVERRLWSAQSIQIILPSLKILDFRGGSAYLEGILARLSAPLLSTLKVEFFNQLTFHLSHLLQFARTTGQFTFRSAEIHFEKEFVSVIVGPHQKRTGKYPFHVQVKCQPLDWQAACVAQICHALEPLLEGVDSLTFGFHRDDPALWQDEIDRAQWHGLLRTFDRVKSLQFTGGLTRHLFLYLQRSEGELPLALLLGLRESVPGAFQTPPLPITAYCDRCDRLFPHDRALEQHKEDSNSHWACDDCDLDFGSYNSLEQHYKQSQNHHYCMECDRHFKSEESRRQHMDDKHWYCRTHDRIFKSEPGLHSHYKENSDHHYCFECEGDFYDEDELWDHLVEDHNACKDCYEVFNSYSELQRHDHEVHIYCARCDRSFQSESNLWHHLNSRLHRP